MKNIVLTRIDDRLIHGQVVTAWIKEYPVNKILIIDDQLSENKLMARIYKSAAPTGIEVELKNLASAILFLKEDALKSENIMILVKVPEIIECMSQEGISIPKVILGGMGAKEGRSTFNRNVSASPEEIACFKRLLDKGINIVYQLVPRDKEADIRKFL